jgi:putative ABC transport system ATP-binding protein
LDAESGQKAMQLLRRLTVESGKTAIVVTHDPRIQGFADRILYMDSGRLIGPAEGRSSRPDPIAESCPVARQEAP